MNTYSIYCSRTWWYHCVFQYLWWAHWETWQSFHKTQRTWIEAQTSHFLQQYVTYDMVIRPPVMVLQQTLRRPELCQSGSHQRLQKNLLNHFLDFAAIIKDLLETVQRQLDHYINLLTTACTNWKLRRSRKCCLLKVGFRMSSCIWDTENKANSCTSTWISSLQQSICRGNRCQSFRIWDCIITRSRQSAQIHCLCKQTVKTQLGSWAPQILGKWWKAYHCRKKASF